MLTTANTIQRRLPFGAEVVDGGVHFRIWAPKRSAVAIVTPGLDDLALAPDGEGYFAGLLEGGSANLLYRVRLDDDRSPIPDPASRFQPEGPHGPSQVIDASGFIWTDDYFPGITPAEAVLYELHVGTFTPEGTWDAATEKLPLLREVGITCIELMPVCEFQGRWNWGYDGVSLFAPSHRYGTPDAMRRFVNHAHELGLAVILDVVYNHLGPDGNYLGEYADTFFSDKHQTDWGSAINFDGPESENVRRFFLANTRYWIETFHLDGYRYDATQNIYDDSARHILAEIADVARNAGGEKRIYLINENEPQHTRLVRPAGQGGHGMDALWNDDFHHSAWVSLTGRNEAYFTDYLGRPQELVSALKYGYLYQGQYYRWQEKCRGTPGLDLPPAAFINYIQNHDQIANFGNGHRVDRLAGIDDLRAMTALMLLAPQTPMLFQGQEWLCSSDFHYFTDHKEELADLIRQGRIREISQFPSMTDPAVVESLNNPSAPETFEASKLNWEERGKPRHQQMLLMTRELLRLRHEDPTLRRARYEKSIDGAVLSEMSLAIRYFGQANDDCLLIHNQHRDEHLHVIPEPLLAPPLGKRWEAIFCTEEPRFGGHGAKPLEKLAGPWRIPGRSATLLKAVDA